MKSKQQIFLSEQLGSTILLIINYASLVVIKKRAALWNLKVPWPIYKETTQHKKDTMHNDKPI